MNKKLTITGAYSMPPTLPVRISCWLVSLLLIIASAALTGCASKNAAGRGDSTIISADGMQELNLLRSLKNNNKKQARGGNNTIRIESLKQTARELGAQGGLWYQSRRWNMVLENNSSLLNRIFNFNYLMLGDRVLPPVLVEASSLLTQDNEQTLHLADHIYRIVRPPRFVTTVPHWRNYLITNYAEPEIPNSTLLPKSKAEQEIWRYYVRLGWSEGVAQADLIFTTNLAKIKTDYLGMVLYRKLLAQKMITPPYTAQADLGVVGDAQKLDVNSKVLRITAVPQFTVDYNKWRPVVAPSQPTTEQHFLPLDQDY